MSRIQESTVEYLSEALFRGLGFTATTGSMTDDAGERGDAAQCLLNGSVRVGAAVEKMAIPQEGCSR